MDKAARVILAATFITLQFAGITTGIIAWVLSVFGVVFLLTSLISFCPLYTIFGLSTCKVNLNSEN
jgi:uncharacterized membrane protein